ncbi:MAG: enoyl-[acyl-carrier-protein] reductase FabK [bacterium]
MSGNKLCDLLDITYPVIQGGMAWVSSPRLAAAVSEAGGLGVLAAGNMSPELFRQQIQETKKLTSKPFGANIVLLSPTAEEAIKVILEEWVPVVFFGGGNPSPYIEELKTRGIKVIPVLASVSLARRLERQGVDAVVAEGWESGGHVGDVSTFCLVPQVVDAVKIPVIAAGGIADNRGFRAALALGASGIQVGTRFICSAECEVHPLYKARILKAGDRDTVVTGYSTGHPVRVIKNAFSRIYAEKERAGASPEELDLLGQGRLRMATVEGDVENGSVMAGAIAGLIKEIKPVREIILEIVGEEE